MIQAAQPNLPPLLTLFVHPDNVKAKNFYRLFGFIDAPIKFTRQPVPYDGMALRV